MNERLKSPDTNIKYGEKILVIPDFDMHLNDESGVLNLLNYYDFSLSDELINKQHKLMIDIIHNRMIDSDVESAQIIIAPPDGDIVCQLIFQYNIKFLVFTKTDAIKYRKIKNIIQILNESIIIYKYIKYININLTNIEKVDALNNAQSLKAHIYSSIVNNVLKRQSKLNGKDYTVTLLIDEERIKRTKNSCKLSGIFRHSPDNNNDNNMLLDIQFDGENILVNDDGIILKKDFCDNKCLRVIRVDIILKSISNNAKRCIHNEHTEEFTFDFGNIQYFKFYTDYKNEIYSESYCIIGDDCDLIITRADKINIEDTNSI